MRRVLESLFSAGGDLVYVFDRAYRYVYVNTRGAAMIGATPEQLLGKTIHDVVPEARAATTLQRIQTAITTGEPSTLMWQTTDDDGNHTYESVVSPIRSEDDAIELVVVAGRDVTDRVNAERRATELQLLTERLAAVLTREQIGALVVEQLYDLLGATAGVAYFTAADGSIRLAAQRNLTPTSAVTLATLSLDMPVPLATAIRTGMPQWFETRDALLAGYPNLASSTVVGSSIDATISMPLVLEGRTYGGVAFSFPRPTRFDPATRRLLTTFALQCAQALERVRLLEDERRARQRLTVLAETSDEMSRTQLDLDRLLDVVCRAIATRMPEACAIALVDGSDTLKIAATHHVDPDAESSLRAALASTPVKLGAGTLGRVAVSGVPALVSVPQIESLHAAAPIAHQEHLARFPVASLVVVPLRIGDRIIGTLASSRSDRLPAFTVDDQTLLQDLADRVALAIDNARLFQAETAARKLRDDFLAIAGHELRTPLSAMQLQIESLLQLAEKGTLMERPPLLVERLGKAVRHVERLERLISQLLDVSQIVDGRLNLSIEDVDLDALITEIVERHADQALRASSRIELTMTEPITGRWDRGRLDQVITNLLDNALKYGRGKPVRVETVRLADRVQVRVCDHGLGVDEAARERIFGRFERAVSDRHYGGLGLGLWISREIVDALGGTIRLDPADAQGTTTFIVELPLRAA